MIQSRLALLLISAGAGTLCFAVWDGLLNNFVVENAAFDGEKIGLLHTFREIPGFLAFTAVYLILFLREQRLAILSLFLMGFGVFITGHFVSVWGLYLTTLIMSVGFHYFETMHLSLALQWFTKDRSPLVFGWIEAVRNVGRVLTYGLLALVFTVGLLDYVPTYMLGGAAAMLVAAGCWLLFPQFKATSPQISNIVVRPRYWLYYMLIFLSGARRQIFMVFAVFMLVEKFGLHIEEMLGVLAVNAVVSAAVGPITGWVIRRYGERAMLVFEYLGLGIIFISYALVTCPEIAIGLYFLDHVFFTLAIGMNSYLKRIAAPEDLAGSAATSFTINHIAAVALPWPLGLLYVAYGSGPVFVLGACIAMASLVSALMIPRHPEPGNETTGWATGVNKWMCAWVPNWGKAANSTQ